MLQDLQTGAQACARNLTTARIAVTRIAVSGLPARSASKI
jgi:hypothetical protein